MKIAMLGLRAIGQGSGGVEKAVEELSIRLAERGHDVTVFCRKKYNEKRLVSYHGVKMVDLPAIYTKHLEAISHTFLGVLHTRSRFDIVHIHATGPSIMSFISRLAGRKVVVTVHGLDWKREKWKGPAKYALKFGAWTAVVFPHKTIVVSQSLQALYKTDYHRETIYIPNGVTPVISHPVSSLRRFNLKGKDYLLYLGRLVPEKGCHLLIKAFRRLTTEHKLLIVGDESHSRDYLETLHKLAHGDPRIIFAGALYGEDKDEAYSNAAAFIFPSSLEGMPIVLLEALSAGQPVLCSDIPENQEIVCPSKSDDHTLAMLFKTGDADDLEEKLKLLLGNSERAISRAHEAMAYVHRTFSWNQVTEETEKVYQSLLSDS